MLSIHLTRFRTVDRVQPRSDDRSYQKHDATDHEDDSHANERDRGNVAIRVEGSIQPTRDRQSLVNSIRPRYEPARVPHDRPEAQQEPKAEHEEGSRGDQTHVRNRTGACGRP